MDYIVIEGARPYDGRYEFDLDGRAFNTREWGWIKRWTGYTMYTLDEGYNDPEVIMTFATIALVRAGKVEKAQGAHVFEHLSEVPFVGGVVKMEPGEEEKAEDDADPSPPSSTSSDATSGPASSPSSETSPRILQGSGMRVSASSVSVPPRSAS